MGVKPEGPFKPIIIGIRAFADRQYLR